MLKCYGKALIWPIRFLDAESAELRLNFVHDSIASTAFACVMRKTPAKIRLEQEKIIADEYITRHQCFLNQMCTRTL